MIDDNNMALHQLVEQRASGDCIRELPAFDLERVAEAEVEARTGAATDAGGKSKSLVSRLCTEIGERVNAFLARPLEEVWYYL